MNRFDTEERAGEPAVRSVVPDQNVSQNTVQDAPQDSYIEYRKLHYKNTIPDNRVLVFLTGFCVGMVFFYLTGGKDASAGSLLDSAHLTLMQNFKVNRLGLFEYVMGLRLKQLLFGVICALSSIGGLMAYSIMGWCGFEVGLIIFTLVYEYGMKGILLTFSMFLPQGIFYCILFLVLFRKYWADDKKYCHNEVTIKGERQHQRVEKMKMIVLVLVMFSIGVLCEVYINPEIMRKIVLLFP